jgi:2-polyprenyl-6-methoxyphenol hydroxylase-like FAD-dependent oxidoreductase
MAWRTRSNATSWPTATTTGRQITGTEVFPLRSSIREPMNDGRLYLLGDSAHIIPPMGAKGMNLALFDAEVFAAVIRDFTATGDDSALRAYSGTCLALPGVLQLAGRDGAWRVGISSRRRRAHSGNGSCAPAWTACCPPTSPPATTRKYSPA